VGIDQVRSAFGSAHACGSKEFFFSFALRGDESPLFQIIA